MGSINFAAPFQLLKPIEVDPARYATEYANLAALAGERQLRQQQIAASQQAMQAKALDIQKTQQGLEDQQTIANRVAQLWQDPTYRDPTSGDFNMTKALNQIRGENIVHNLDSLDAIQKSVDAIDQTHAQTKNLYSQAAKADQESADAKYKAGVQITDMLGNIGADYVQNPDPAHLEGTLLHMEDAFRDAPNMKQALENVRANIAADPTHAIQLMQNLADGMSAEGKQARIKQAQTAQETATSKAQAAEAQARADELGYKLSLMKKMGNLDPAQNNALIDSMLPPAQFPVDNANFKRRINNIPPMTDVDKMAEAYSNILKEAQERASKYAPETMAGKATEAQIVEQATMPYKISEQYAAQRALHGGTGAVANVAPDLINAATTAGLKSEQSYNNAIARADDVQTVIDAALSGSKTAGANLPIVGTGAINAINGIKRINRVDVEQYGGAGSLLDKLQGELQGWTEGQPISRQVLEDMQAFHQELAQNALPQHQNEINSVNKYYNSTFAPSAVRPREPAAMRNLPAGNGKAIDKATAQKFYDAAGGDPARARKMATDKGWVVPQQ